MAENTLLRQQLIMLKRQVKRHCKPWHRFCTTMACLLRSPLIAIRALFGNGSGRDFPSAFVRFLLCLGIHSIICPPHRSDLNAFVERSHRSLKQECLLVTRPHTLEDVREANEAFVQHYNHERPNQALTCGNLPPCVAFPSLPTLPPVPDQIDPDAWLGHVHGQHFIRHPFA